MLAGLILGLAAAFLRDSLDDAVTTKETAEEFGGSTVLAAVPMVTSWKKRDRPLVVSLARPMSPAAEAYRSLRTSLQFARQERDLHTILVTSPAAAEGKTSTLSNLGAMFAQTGQRVVLVSCDLRKPRLGQFFGIDEKAGLTTAILGEQPVEELIQAVPGDDNLWLLGSGELPPNPAELLNGRRIQEVFAALRELFDLVLIDSPPVLPVTDAVVLAKDADATLLIVAAGQTSRGDLQRAAEKLAQVNARVVGPGPERDHEAGRLRLRVRLRLRRHLRDRKVTASGAGTAERLGAGHPPRRLPASQVDDWRPLARALPGRAVTPARPWTRSLPLAG